MEEKLKLIANLFGMDRVKLNESLIDHTASRSTGKAGLFFIAFTNNEIKKMVDAARDLKIPVIVFGTGTKMISDLGYEGVVIKNRTQKISIVSFKGNVSKSGLGLQEALIEVNGGVTLSKLADYLSSQGLEDGGIKNIPGSVGGNLFINKPLIDKVQRIKVLEDGEQSEVTHSDLNLRKHIILSAIFKYKAKV